MVSTLATLGSCFKYSVAPPTFCQVIQMLFWLEGD